MLFKKAFQRRDVERIVVVLRDVIQRIDKMYCTDAVLGERFGQKTRAHKPTSGRAREKRANAADKILAGRQQVKVQQRLQRPVRALGTRQIRAIWAHHAL